MDYAAFDRWAVQYLVSCVLNGTRFYLSESGTATDIQERAARFRDYAEADRRAASERSDPAWNKTFAWFPVRRIMGGMVLV